MLVIKTKASLGQILDKFCILRWAFWPESTALLVLAVPLNSSSMATTPVYLNSVSCVGVVSSQHQQIILTDIR